MQSDDFEIIRITILTGVLRTQLRKANMDAAASAKTAANLTDERKAEEAIALEALRAQAARIIELEAELQALKNVIGNAWETKC